MNTAGSAACQSSRQLCERLLAWNAIPKLADLAIRGRRTFSSHRADLTPPALSGRARAQTATTGRRRIFVLFGHLLELLHPALDLGFMDDVSVLFAALDEKFSGGSETNVDV